MFEKKKQYRLEFWHPNGLGPDSTTLHAQHVIDAARTFVLETEIPTSDIIAVYETEDQPNTE